MAELNFNSITILLYYTYTYSYHQPELTSDQTVHATAAVGRREPRGVYRPLLFICSVLFFQLTKWLHKDEWYRFIWPENWISSNHCSTLSSEQNLFTAVSQYSLPFHLRCTCKKEETDLEPTTSPQHPSYDNKVIIACHGCFYNELCKT